LSTRILSVPIFVVPWKITYGDCGNYVVISFKYLAVFASYSVGLAIGRTKCTSMRLVHHVSKVRNICKCKWYSL